MAQAFHSIYTTNQHCAFIWCICTANLDGVKLAYAQWVSYLLTLASLGVTAAVTWGIGLFVAKDTFYKFSVTKLK
ncbi:hypothetical protein C1149_03260 [Clostridium botulinum]|nr:hypothetical protein C1149_03260 [Clostridium botulinum]